MSRTLAIGDVHGCHAALQALLGWLEPCPDDTLVFLGDYVDRGPDSRGVLETLLALADRCRLVPLLGNHEEMLLAAGDSPADLAFWLRFGGQETLESYGGTTTWSDLPPRHLEFLRNCRPWHQTESGLFFHAAYVSDLPPDAQPPQVLRWQSLAHSCPGPHVSGKTAFVGHTRQTSGRLLDLGYLVCLDTYCYGGGWLTALDVATGQWWQTNQQGGRRAGQRQARPAAADVDKNSAGN